MVIVVFLHSFSGIKFLFIRHQHDLSWSPYKLIKIRLNCEESGQTTSINIQDFIEFSKDFQPKLQKQNMNYGCFNHYRFKRK
jgi:hypothetical protein